MRGQMTTHRFVATAAAIILTAVSLGAQAKPDFSGKWVMNPPPAAAPAGNAGGARGGGAAGFQPGFGPEFTVKQDAKALVITRGGQAGTLTYNLDGTESRAR